MGLSVHKVPDQEDKGFQGGQQNKPMHGIGSEKGNSPGFRRSLEPGAGRGQDTTLCTAAVSFVFFWGLSCILQGMHLGFAHPEVWKEHGSKQAEHSFLLGDIRLYRPRGSQSTSEAGWKGFREERLVSCLAKRGEKKREIPFLPPRWGYIVI